MLAGTTVAPRKVVIPLGTVWLVLVAATNASTPISFRGTFSGITTSVTPNMLTQVGDGNLTIMGNANFTSIGVLSAPRDTYCLDSVDFQRTFTGHNGDQLRFSIIGETCPTPDPNVAKFVGTYFIEGGTGKFQGASGNGTVSTLVNVSTGDITGQMTGYIFIAPVNGETISNVVELSSDSIPVYITATAIVAVAVVSLLLVILHSHRKSWGGAQPQR